MEKYDPSRDISPHPPSRPDRGRKAWRFLRNCVIAMAICVGIYFFIYNPHLSSNLKNGPADRLPVAEDEPPTPLSAIDEESVPLDPTVTPESKRVPFEAHIMSKCPDARDCLAELVVPAMVHIHEKVDFRLSYIGSASDSSSDVSCMHGPSECVGDMLLLCAANLPFAPGTRRYPKTPTVRSLGFANCLISSYEKIPERTLVEDCALEHGIDFRSLNDCASRQEDERDGQYGDPNKISGLALLRKDFKRNEDLGISTSCTVRLDEKEWCVRDGGEWTDCAKAGEGSDVSVLIKEVEELYERRNK